MAATRIEATVDSAVIDEARRASGLTAAPLAQLVRAGLLALAGRTDAKDAARVKMGRPPKIPR